MYLVHAIEKFHVIPWLMIEFGFCALWSFFFFTAALAFAVKVRHNFPNMIEYHPTKIWMEHQPLFLLRTHLKRLAPDNTCSYTWVTHAAALIHYSFEQPQYVATYVLKDGWIREALRIKYRIILETFRNGGPPTPLLILWFHSGWSSFPGCWCSVWVCMLSGELSIFYTKNSFEKYLYEFWSWLQVYGTDAFFKFRGWRAGQLAQGERRITETSAHHLPTY